MTPQQELIKAVLDLIYELDPELLKKWIHDTWPHGIGLYE